MITISTVIDINAPARRTWELLTDFDLYPHWNPLFRRAGGVPALHGRIDLVMELPGLPPFELNPVITALEPERELAWQNRLAIPGMLAWQYRFLLDEPQPHQQRVTQCLTFSGLLAPLFVLVMKRFLLAGADLLNRALLKWAGKEVQCLRC